MTPATASQQQSPSFEDLQTDNPAKLQQNFFAFNSGDKRLTGAMLALAVTAKFYYGSLAAMLVVAIWVCVMWRQNNGRHYQLFLNRLSDIRLVRFKHNIVWESSNANQRSAPIPLTISVVSDEIGLIRNLDANTDSLVISGSGSGIPTQEMIEQFDSQRRIAGITKLAASIPGYRIGLSYVFRRRPTNVRHLQDESLNHFQPDVVLPKGKAEPLAKLTIEDRRYQKLSDNTEANYSWIEKESGDVEMVSVWTLSRPRTLAEAAKGKKVDLAKISRLPTFKVETTAREGLAACGITDVETYAEGNLQNFLRSSWEINPASFHNWAADYVNGITDERKKWSPEKSIRAYHDHIVFDDTNFHAVLRLTSNQPHVLPWMHRQLFGLNIPELTIALVGEAVSGNTEIAIMNRIIPLFDAIDEGLYKVHKTPGQLAKEQERDRRQFDLFTSKFGQNYSVYVAIGATSLEVLDNHVDDAEAAIRNLEMKSQRITGASRQLPALMSATTGISLL